MKKFQQGFTLAEILIVISIIALLSIVALMSIFGQMAHATDIKRKADLSTLSKFFEDYYNDNSVFPDQPAVNDCGGTMAPYITNIPCDPASKTPYGYFPSVNGGYRICTKLTDTTDPAIAAAGCSGATGCGLGGPSSGGVYNYCLASGVTASAVGTADEIIGTPTPTPTPGVSTPTPTPTSTPAAGTPTSTPTPTPTPGPTNLYACTPNEDFYGKGVCNHYYQPYGPPPGGDCPIAWPDACPPGACDVLVDGVYINRCTY